MGGQGHWKERNRAEGRENRAADLGILNFVSIWAEKLTSLDNACIVGVPSILHLSQSRNGAGE